ncbi:DUF1796 family putative cysteine peptidase [Terribacillus saccharophilus]|uniref:Peptidase n=1 Tax=Terribacillus saccharophilus TaxID=361277 RepID=A0A268ADY4_9BACI|nr:DUF1796 family putative cysteine peptidase [Terribacillus saccharophilus]PAD22332.1 peptidase [Terribacillus saccharophilus]PAF19067.1 peptidase [Terribacillus saccharophilus]PAF36916.1 peptidase [Terribacillus saccharophilus]PAF39643.1 peptidase [Terribacillus saccharophilus]
MGNELIKGGYDAVFSLGDLCVGAIQLQKNNLRPFSGPLDWMGTPLLPKVTQLFEKRFADFMLQENLRIVGKATEQMLLVSDDRNYVMSNHDFDTTHNSLTHLPMYPQVKEKLDRRVNRLLEKLITAQRILFVRTNATLEETAELERVLRTIIANDFRILVVNHSPVSGIVEKHWPINNVYSVELPNIEIWEGNNALWAQLFQDVHLI